MAGTNGTYEMSVLFEFVVPGVLLNCVGILGLIGNTLSIIVLSRPQMKSSINCILIGLASYDTILILTSILMFGLPAVHTYTQNLFRFYFYDIFPFITPAVYPIGMIAQTGSVYLTMCVTVERYVAVCLPLKARSLCTFGRARYYVLCIGLFALLYNIPRFWEVTWQTVYYPELKANITNVVPTNMRDNPTYINVYITWLYLVVMYIVPFTCLAAFNARIYYQVRRANNERSRLTRLQQKEIGLATMLMVVVVVFFVCNILALVVNILEVLSINIIALNNVSNLLVTCNSSVNIIIYCIFGEKFQRIFVSLFCPAFIKERSDAMFLHRYPDHQGDGGGGGLGLGVGGGDCHHRNTWHNVQHQHRLTLGLYNDLTGVCRAISATSLSTGIVNAKRTENTTINPSASLSLLNVSQDQRHGLVPVAQLDEIAIDQRTSPSQKLVGSPWSGREDDTDEDEEDEAAAKRSRRHSATAAALVKAPCFLGKIPILFGNIGVNGKPESKASPPKTNKSRVSKPPKSSRDRGLDDADSISRVFEPHLMPRVPSETGSRRFFKRKPKGSLRCSEDHSATACSPLQETHHVRWPGSKHDITITVNINTCTASSNNGNGGVPKGNCSSSKNVSKANNNTSSKTVACAPISKDENSGDNDNNYLLLSPRSTSCVINNRSRGRNAIDTEATTSDSALTATSSSPECNYQPRRTGVTTTAEQDASAGDGVCDKLNFQSRDSYLEPDGASCESLPFIDG